MPSPPALSFAAVDLGASGGRVITARVGDGVLDLTTAHRFGNRPVRLAGTLYWDIPRLYAEVCEGLRRTGPVASIGIDTWGIDYGLLDAGGALLGNPVSYRDPRTGPAYERLLSTVGPASLYESTGTQLIPMNTIFQLAAAPPPAGAATLLMLPDLLAYRLTGAIGAEVTNASTTGLYDVRTGTWSDALITRLGLPRRIFPELRRPGDTIGPLRADVAAELGAMPANLATETTRPRTGDGAARPSASATLGVPPGTPVVAVGSHDTASAVYAVPAEHGRFAYVSCGTWSLVGVELPAPVISDAGRAAGFTNEVGVGGTIRYLRNVMGLWLLQESLRTWNLGDADLPGLLAAAEDAPPFAALVDPSDPSFTEPGDMPARLAAYCRRTGQAPPPDRPAMVRCILESLALAHRAAVRDAARLTGRPVDVVHMVGGGARNTLLCRLTASACGIPVVAGPYEATAIGNALVQARARGLAPDPRALVRATQPLITYEPEDPEPAWTAAADRIR